MKMLSSYSTLAWKTVIPAMGIWLMSLGLLAEFNTEAAVRSPVGIGGLIVGFVPVTLVTLALVHLALHVKQVELCDDELHITNYWKRCVIPLRSVAKVTEWRGRPSLITLHLNIETVFGRKILFMPGIVGWKRHGAADELRSRLNVLESASN